MSYGTDIAALSHEFETGTPPEILRWAVDTCAPGIAVPGKTACGLRTDLFHHKDPSEVGDQFVYRVEGLK